MKNITILMVILINISCNSQKETNSYNYFKEKSYLDENEINGKVKSISYFYSKNGEDKEKTFKIIFNNNGNRKEEFKYYTDGGSPDITTFFYDKKGATIKIETNFNKSSTTVIENNKRFVKQYENSELILTDIETRDKNGNILEFSDKVEKGDGKFNTKNICKYDERNNLISQESYQGKELSLTVTNLREYNKSNKIILNKYLNSIGKVYEYNKYYYDKEHNLIKVEYMAIPSEQEEKRGEDIYIYNTNNQVVEYHKNRISNFENSTKKAYQYKNNNLIEEKIFDENDKVLEVHKFKYDSFNNQVLKETKTIEEGKTEIVVVTRVYKYYQY